MRTEIFDQYIDEDDKVFNRRISDFIKGKQVIQITINNIVGTDCFYATALTVIYK